MMSMSIKKDDDDEVDLSRERLSLAHISRARLSLSHAYLLHSPLSGLGGGGRARGLGRLWREQQRRRPVAQLAAHTFYT